MPIRREFLGWNRPVLPEAAHWLVARYRLGQVFDLSSVIVVVPGLRAGRRLRELLASAADDETLLYTPPQVVTEGRLPELLYSSNRPFASDLAQDLAWTQAFQSLNPQSQSAICPHPPNHDNALAWFELAKSLRRLHVELAAEGKDFDDVAPPIARMAGKRETLRWQALAEAQSNYLAVLRARQLDDVHQARRQALQEKAVDTKCDIVLLATVDLNAISRQMISRVSGKVTALIAAPPENEHQFDELGCLRLDSWINAQIPITDDQLRQVGGPIDQAIAVCDWLAGLDGQYSADEVVIGVPDESIAPQLQRELKQFEVESRFVEGMAIRETLPFRLLKTASAYAERRHYEDLAALVRHPDVEMWLGIELAQSLDRYQNERIPSQVTVDTIAPAAESWPELSRAVAKIESWLAPATSHLKLREWSNTFRTILGTIYSKRSARLERRSDDLLLRSIERIVAVLDEIDTLPAELDSIPLSASSAFRVIFTPIAQESLPPPAAPSVVQILGWLELPLDDAPALVVTSFNEGFVPQSTGSDLFLPDRLRMELGLLHNQRRYARDAYAVTLLVHSRAQLRIVFARRDAKNDPLQPSRLIFACDDATLVARAKEFFDEPRASATPRRLAFATLCAIPDESLFAVPRPVATGKKLDRFPVTRFKDYIACPYRYYLRHVKKIQAVEDSSRELEGNAFGSLLHFVLGEFGRDANGLRQSDDPGRIAEYLQDQLQAIAASNFGGKQTRPAIRLQIEQARRRLVAFSHRQADLVRQGWQIVHAEDPDELEAPFAIEDGHVSLIGRIDRIDYNQSLQTLRILDYKTGDSGKTPDKTHKDWSDLQLPLYRHLLPAVKPQLPQYSQLELGYLNLPKALDETGVELANWDEFQLQSADDKARMVVNLIRQEQYWPPADVPPKYSDDFAAICLDNSFRGPAICDESEVAS